MNSQNKFNFSKSDLISKNNNTLLPLWCGFSMEFAHYRVNYRFKGMDLYRMYYHYRPFSIDLIQINSHADTTPFCIETTEKQTILFIMLEGNLSGGLAKTEYHSINEYEFTISNCEQKKWTLQPAAGRHSFLIITIDHEWFEVISKNLKNVIRNVNTFENELDRQTFVCKLTREASQWAKNIYTFSHKNIGAIDGNLRMQITFLVEYYYQKIEAQKESLAFRIMYYLDRHYQDANLSVKYLAEYFCVTERTLRNHFKRQFGKTIHRYYTDLRMKRAVELINNNGLSAKEIYFKIGYNDESSFRYAYMRYLANINELGEQALLDKPVQTAPS